MFRQITQNESVICMSGSEWSDVTDMQDFHNSSQVWLPIKTIQASPPVTFGLERECEQGGHSLQSTERIGCQRLHDTCLNLQTVCVTYSKIQQRLPHQSSFHLWTLINIWLSEQLFPDVWKNIATFVQVLFSSKIRTWSSCNSVFMHVACWSLLKWFTKMQPTSCLCDS